MSLAPEQEKGVIGKGLSAWTCEFVLWGGGGCISVWACICDMSKPVVFPTRLGHLLRYKPRGVSKDVFGVCGRINASTCVLQISVQPPAVQACIFCLNACWASLHGSGLMDGIVCWGGLCV